MGLEIDSYECSETGGHNSIDGSFVPLGRACATPCNNKCPESGLSFFLEKVFRCRPASPVLHRIKITGVSVRRVRRTCLGVVVLKRVILGCILGLLSVAVAGGDSNEASLRVPFVYKFIKFIEWPGQASSPGLRLCALGATGDTRRVLQELDKRPVSPQVAADRPVATQVIELVFLDDPSTALAQLESCQMIYRPLGGTAIALPTPLPPGVFLVADNPGAYETNVGIAIFRSQEGRIEFAISMAAAKQAGVNVSSQLLKLARYRRGGR